MADNRQAVDDPYPEPYPEPVDVPARVSGAPVTGYDDKRATALTVVLPLKVGSTIFLRPWLWLLRRRYVRHFAVGTLDRQRFVLAIRWSLLPPFDPPKGPWPRSWWPFKRAADTRRFLLFESNFDGDWDEYLDVFGAVMTYPIQTLIYWGRGFPGLDDVDLFKRYAKAHDVEPDHYLAAYPLTAADIYQELIARDGHRAHQHRNRFGYGRNRPGWLTLLFPLKPSRSSDAHAIARSFSDDDRRSCPFVSTGLVHFARAMVLHRPSGDWLLVTVTHDAHSAEGLLRTIAYGEQAPSLRRLLACTVGAPDDAGERWSPEETVAHLARAVPEASRSWMAYCGYPGRTVREIEGLVEQARASQTWPEPELR